MTQNLWVIPNSIERWNYIHSGGVGNPLSPTRGPTYANFEDRLKMDLHTILKPHIGIKLCRIECCFIFMEWVNPSNDPPTRNSKNLKIKVLASFWKPMMMNYWWTFQLQSQLSNFSETFQILVLSNCPLQLHASRSYPYPNLEATLTPIWKLSQP